MTRDFNSLTKSRSFILFDTCVRVDCFSFIISFL